MKCALESCICAIQPLDGQHEYMTLLNEALLNTFTVQSMYKYVVN